MHVQKHYISAGDLEKFSYCPVNWKISKTKKVDISGGVSKHKDAARGGLLQKTLIDDIKQMETIILIFSVVGTIISIFGLTFFIKHLSIFQLLLIVSFIWIFVGIIEILISHLTHYNKWMNIVLYSSFLLLLLSLFIYYFLPGRQEVGIIFEIVGIFWLAGASFALYFSLLKENKLNILQKKYGLPEGQIVYIDDLEENTPVMFSDKYDISGRPDFVVLVKGDYIPIEYKSGRIPRGPLFSHIIQLTAYCILVEEKYGKTPPYGIIKYGKKDFQIEYTDDLKELVLKKVAEIKQAELTGIAHRNHNNPNRCLGCSRREFCDEKLA